MAINRTFRKRQVNPPKMVAHLMVKARPESAKWIRAVAKARRLTHNSVVDILVDGFKRLPADVQAQLFGDGAGAGAA